MQWRQLALTGLLLLLATPVSALRCGNRLVSTGTPQAKVLHYCGDPDSVQVRSLYRGGIPRRIIPDDTPGLREPITQRELLIADRTWVEVRVEEWLYNFGPHRLMRLIRFENGRVVSVTRLGYGYR